MQNVCQFHIYLAFISIKLGEYRYIYLQVAELIVITMKS